MKFKLTIEKLLNQSKQLRFVDIPFSKEIFFYLPEDLELDLDTPCQQVLEIIKSSKHAPLLKTKIEDILVEDENKKTRRLIRWAFLGGIVGSFLALAVVLYLAVISQEAPDFWLISVLVGIPAGIMWTHSGVLKAENAKSLGKVLGSIVPARFGTLANAPVQRDDDDDEEMYRNKKKGKRKSSVYQDELDEEVNQPIVTNPPSSPLPEQKNKPVNPRREYTEDNNGNPF